MILDTYCCAGGCSRGYSDAGFEVVGVDIVRQPRYPYPMVVGDSLFALESLIEGDVIVASDGVAYRLDDFDAIHASPPCQAYSKSTGQWRNSGREYPDLIAPTRELLIKTGKPYVIENVPGAPLRNPTMLNGAMFGMLVHRDRYFETNFDIPFFLTPMGKKPTKMGRPVKDGDVIIPVGHFSSVDYARKQMGIDWMSQYELAQAIPPKYTEYIGKYLIDHLEKRHG